MSKFPLPFEFVSKQPLFVSWTWCKPLGFQNASRWRHFSQKHLCGLLFPVIFRKTSWNSKFDTDTVLDRSADPQVLFQRARRRHGTQGKRLGAWQQSSLPELDFNS
ncbi:hypothetical protein CEXT_68431 [Caerostris extrusa]|uniref:Uncharacterized protein n=1 Tax=Caerostris extrusa TaxID=172846 RepID=A0AAV4MNJ8_CAEEX|nr:hypothetical protein CEXT_68431 [Caerostris extrusa]